MSKKMLNFFEIRQKNATKILIYRNCSTFFGVKSSLKKFDPRVKKKRKFVCLRSKIAQKSTKNTAKKLEFRE